MDVEKEIVKIYKRLRNLESVLWDHLQISEKSTDSNRLCDLDEEDPER